MASQELLLVLVVDVLEDKQPADVVDEHVLLKGVIVHSVLVLAIVTDGVLHLKQLAFYHLF